MTNEFPKMIWYDRKYLFCKVCSKVTQHAVGHPDDDLHTVLKLCKECERMSTIGDRNES
jgi:hypothetical protein